LIRNKRKFDIFSVFPFLLAANFASLDKHTNLLCDPDIMNQKCFINSTGPVWLKFSVLLGQPLYLAYKWAQKAGVLWYTRLEKLASEKHSSLFGSFVGDSVL
jgi:hypothetical protein